MKIKKFIKHLKKVQKKYGKDVIVFIGRINCTTDEKHFQELKENDLQCFLTVNTTVLFID